jgi:polyisoprenoid-binding protein YceI
MATQIPTGIRLTTEVPAEVGKATVWEIDPKHTLVEFSVRHMMFTTVKGRFTGVRGVIHCVDEADPSQAQVEAEIDAASISTGDEQRDAHLRSADFLDTENHPKITFKSTRVDARNEEELRLVGELTVHGITREVTLETTFNGRGKNPYGQEVAGFSAQTTINRKEFGLTWNAALESGGLLVGNNLEIMIEVQAIRQG